ncbi:MAG: amidase [Alphaproteobacteria bacterium]
MQDYEKYDALGLAELVAKGEVTPDELLDEAIARTEHLNPKLNAVVSKWYDEARADIKAGLPDGPFKGVPFLLKDLNLYWEGRRTTNGSALFKDYIADHTSTLVQRYRDAGFVIFGQTNSPELGLTPSTEPRLHGPTRNPWNLDHTPGGSSGGASAAVSAGILPMANASDGGGSIRIPAACCGLFGLKPTRARTPVGPMQGEGWAGCSISHAVSWSVRDSAALLDATHGPSPGDPYFAPAFDGSFLDASKRDPGKLKIAYSTEALNGVETDKNCKNLIIESLELMLSLGHEVEEAQPPVSAEEIGAAQMAIIGTSARMTFELRAEQLGRELTQDDVELIPWLMIENAKTLPTTAYPKAVRTIHQLGRTMAQFLDKYDVFMTPTLGRPPVELGHLDMMNPDPGDYMSTLASFVNYCGYANMSGQPAMSLPLGHAENGLPIGVMVTGRFGDDDLLLSLAGQIERAAPWAGRRPEIS